MSLGLRRGEYMRRGGRDLVVSPGRLSSYVILEILAVRFAAPDGRLYLDVRNYFGVSFDTLRNITLGRTVLATCKVFATPST